MADEIIEEKVNEEVVIPGPFSEGAWKSVPATEAEIVEEIPIVEEVKQEVKPEVIAEIKEESTKDEIPFIKFANEESEKVYNLLREGKQDEVFAVMSEQKKLASVDTMKPEDVIKLHLQYENKEFTTEEINDLFSDRYEMPESPTQRLDEDDDDFKIREEKYGEKVKRLESRIAREAKLSSTELKKLQQEILLPEIPKNQIAKQEPTQEELDAMKKQNEIFMKSVEDGLNSFEGYKSTFKDEEVEFNVAYNLTKEDKDEIQPIIALAETNAGAFLESIGWIGKDGNINIAKLTEDLPVILKKDKVFSEIVKEAGSLRHKESLKGIKNINFDGGQSKGGDFGETPEQMQKNMANHFFTN